MRHHLSREAGPASGLPPRTPTPHMAGETGKLQAPAGAGWWGTGPPLQGCHEGTRRDLVDGAGLCSTGSWLLERRRLPGGRFAEVTELFAHHLETLEERLAKGGPLPQAGKAVVCGLVEAHDAGQSRVGPAGVLETVVGFGGLGNFAIVGSLRVALLGLLGVVLVVRERVAHRPCLKSHAEVEVGIFPGATRW